MPLLDHFHPPLSAERRWESFHSSWATRLVDTLTERWLPPNYIAEEQAHIGPSIEIDVATFERETAAAEEGGGDCESEGVGPARGRWRASFGVPGHVRGAGVIHGHRAQVGRCHRTDQP